MGVQQLYEQVTRTIISEIEAGNLPPWLQPWKAGKRGGIIPINAVTKKSYNGLNVLMLWAERQEKQYALAEWLTYKQCQEAGGQVRKGEKSTPGIYVNKQVIEKGTEEERLVPFMRQFALFNVAQCDGLPQNEPIADLPEHERNEQAEAFFAAIGATTRWGEPKAAYSPSLDIIVMPERGAFLNPESLYATWAHEHIHLTGHKSRLDRDLKSRFDQDAYAFEELVAEIGAAMTCAHLQVKGELRHASYVDHWLRVLKQDSRAILSAASMASKATDYLRAFSETKQEEAA
ncbi:antirestriction protein [Nitrobacter hamburgensis X14]|uniref:Antirestriction protein n=1 Tax=Nitrobacter hamburgensis (strain DSM 10229 / NCIMB 13809 / X14) TaxID=323097 RepID=Q1QRE5_NITHX|nr:zincin-like metallopeptidase domain-containing protein [Nitrobacter hamburgensis]ABE61202.1 antirestriction protein [Nitrobacter hamburgensis X14]